MDGGWMYGGAAADVGGEAVTLVEGASFCVGDASGDIRSGSPQGVFFMDTRVISTWRVMLDTAGLDHLAAFVDAPHHATFLGRGRSHRPGQESTLLVQRERYVGAGMREDIIVRNVGQEPATVRIDVHVDADFADLFAVKEGRTLPATDRGLRVGDGVLELERATDGSRRGVRVRGLGAVASTGRLTFRQVIGARQEWSTTIEALATIDGLETTPRYPVGEPLEDAAPSVRLHEWTAHTPTVSGVDEELCRTLQRTQQDLGSLRIFDPQHPGRAAIAAGAPWFMALFGRDSLLTAYMTLPLDQELALGTLHTLARYQGTRLNPVTEEQPGRILHEMRFGVEASLALGGDKVYYGTVDATPLFVCLLGELWRWGLSGDDLDLLLPHADRALHWVTTDGDIDGDGFVEYRRLTEHGLRNQGWKDSWDGINFADGTIAEAPIALCEVQAYVYQALVSRAAIARHQGDADRADSLARRAADLKSAFNERFWLEDKGWFAVGLDRTKTPIDALASNMGHCLWAGIVDDDKAPRVAEVMLSPEMFSGWGIRTLATTMGAYNPLSYHNGSVWPHDNAIAVAGLMRYGFVKEAQTVARAVLDAAGCFDGRLPELFTGFDRQDFPRPVPYPTSCSPQAWAAAAPLSLLRSLLRFDPDLPRGEVSVAPALPRSIPTLRVGNVPLAGARLAVAAGADAVTIDGLPSHVRAAYPDDAEHDPHRR
jgi:glycogen debranching enzyme